MKIVKLPSLWIMRTLTWVLWLSGGILATGLLMLMAAFVWFKFWMLPNLENYRPQLEQQLSQMLAHRVEVARLSGRWSGTVPEFEIEGIRIPNQQGQALTLHSITVALSWRSLFQKNIYLDYIILKQPRIEIRRSTKNEIYLNGIKINFDMPYDYKMTNWILQQPRLEIQDAYLSWQDDLVGLPKVDLSQGQFSLRKELFRHRLKLSGVSEATLGKKLDLNASWSGDDITSWTSWSGTVTAQLFGASVGAWSRYWEQQLGMVTRGQGNGKIALSFSQGTIESLNMDVNVQHIAYTTADMQQFVLPRLSGKLLLKRLESGRYQVQAKNLTLASASGLAFDRATIEGEWSTKDGGKVKLDNANVEHLYPFARALGANHFPLLAQFSPKGQIQNASLSWQGRWQAPARLQIRSDFRQLFWQPFAQFPGVANVSGHIDMTNNGGRLVLSHGESALHYPLIFTHHLFFKQLQGQVEWQNQGQVIALNIKSLAFKNADLEGQVQGYYRYTHEGAGQADLQAKVKAIAATRVPYYLPHQAGQATINWLKAALQGGEVHNITLQLKGDLDQFPFKGGKKGLFEVHADVSQGQLKYDSDWPPINQIQAKLLFKNERIEIQAPEAVTLGIPLRQVKVEIPDLSAEHPRLNVYGKATDQLQSMLNYAIHSPVDHLIAGFTRQLQAKGAAQLGLALNIPLSGSHTTKVVGNLQFVDSRLVFKTLPIPILEQVKGSLCFTEQGVTRSVLYFKSLGGAFTLKARMDKQRMQFGITGNADSRQVMQFYLPPLAAHVAGRASYQVAFAVQNNDLEYMTVTSNLEGTRFNLPQPLNKPANSQWPLQLAIVAQADAGFPRHWNLSVGNVVAGEMTFRKDGTWQALNLGVGKALSAKRVGKGINIEWAQPLIQFAEWKALLQQQETKLLASFLQRLPIRLKVATPQLKLSGVLLHDVDASIEHHRPHTPWTLQITSKEVSGALSYQAEGNGILHANLSRVALNKDLIDAAEKPSAQNSANQQSTYQQHDNLPTINIQVKELLWKGNTIGRLSLLAQREGVNWRMDPITLTTPEGTLKAAILAAPQQVSSRFTFDIKSGGLLLTRMGYPNVFNNGQGTLHGVLTWPGTITSLDVEKVSGELTLDISKGQFAKANPGIARLLGVLSLQSLPRRIRLDFTDVFTEGFAFDSLKGKAQAKQGIFKTEQIKMQGPAANVAIAGEVNLVRATQSLTVHVEPHAAESVALAAGTALLNPMIGIVTLAAQKILQDPVGKILSVDYVITGSLKDPQITRIGEARRKAL